MLADKRRSLSKGILTGFAAGGLASVLMDLYWWAVHHTPGARPEQQPRPGGQEEYKPSTQIMADKAWKLLTGEEVSKENKAVAGVIAHYAFGVSCGAIFGAVAARSRRLGLLAGLLYGVAIWLLFDEIGLRALNIAPDPEKVPAGQHVKALGAHLVYGSGTALITRLLLEEF